MIRGRVGRSARAWRLAVAVAMVQLAACQSALVDSAEAAPVALDRTTVTVTTSAGRTHAYKVEVARSPEQQARGLMYRKSMPRDAGMLFPFDPPRPASFWMANTDIPLDIIFIGADGRVPNVGAGKPLNQATVDSVGVAAAVLELNAGEAARIGLKPGDRIRWK